MMYKHLISVIKNTDNHGIMNQLAIGSLFHALKTPVLYIEVINTLIFLID